VQLRRGTTEMQLLAQDEEYAEVPQLDRRQQHVNASSLRGETPLGRGGEQAAGAGRGGLLGVCSGPPDKAGPAVPGGYLLKVCLPGGCHQPGGRGVKRHYAPPLWGQLLPDDPSDIGLVNRGHLGSVFGYFFGTAAPRPA
jgi:hypothetical protein